MVNIILMSHFPVNQDLYSGIFSRIPFVRFTVIPIDGPDVNTVLDVLANKMKELNFSNDDIDFIMLSSNYGKPGDDEVNAPMFHFFLNNFKHAMIIALGNTSASLLKALELDERIFIMGTSVGDIDLELVSNVYSKGELKPRICSFKCLRKFLQIAESAKQQGKRLDDINTIKERLCQNIDPKQNMPEQTIPKSPEKKELFNALSLVQSDMKNMSIEAKEEQIKPTIERAKSTEIAKKSL